MRAALGYAMLAAPFVALFVGMIVTIGVLPAVIIFAATALLAAWINIAVSMLP